MTGLVINLNYDASVASAPAGFTAAMASVVQFFEGVFSDPVTITIDVGFGEIDNQAMAAGALGESLPFIGTLSYAQLRASLLTDAKSPADLSAAATLPALDPTGGGQFLVTQAEAKALGLVGSFSPVDGFVGFSNTLPFDYDEANGVSPGQFDFFAVAAHEISEVMGRRLGVGQDIPGLGNIYFPFDLFHYSAPGVRDFGGTEPGYFSTDGGATDLASFNTIPGGDFGDWADSVGDDAFRARSLPGVINSVTAADIAALDVIGWDADHPPAVTSLNPTFHGAQSIPAARLFQASDIDGNPITAYELWDPVAGNGNFTVNGIAQPARQVIDLSSLAGLAWDTSVEAGSTVFAVRAFDGFLWSDWTTVNVTATDAAPRITSLDASFHGAEILPSASLFQATDPDGDQITEYQFWDPAAGDGGLTLGGAPEPARQVVDVAAASLATLAWDTAGQSGSAVFAVRAFDGTLWSDWTTITVAEVDAPPRITSLNVSVHGPQLIAPASLFQATDPEGDPITRYELWDPVAGNGGFALASDREALPARQVIDAASLTNLAWDTTGQDGSAVFAARAFDGTLWSDWTVVNVTVTDAAPQITSLNATAQGAQSLALTSLFQATDPDGDPITEYQLWDPIAGDGGFTTNGSPLSARGVVTVFPAGVSSIAWDTTGQSGSTVFAVRAFDGSLWSDWTTVAVNDAPAPGLAAPAPGLAAPARLVQALASDTVAAPVTTGPLPMPGDAVAPLPLAATAGHS